MANREPIQYVEMDIDYCSLSYGTGACAAILGTTGDLKCFNTFKTCQDTVNFTKSIKTLKFINNRANLPKGLQAYPCLRENGITAFSSTVNIAGGNSKYNAFGRRATVDITLDDFIDSDTYLDKYQAERVSGAAQASSVGYNPKDRGTFFTRLKSRFPYYAGRPLRIIDGYIDEGVLTVEQTRHFIVTDMKGPDSNGSVTLSGKDVLALADDKKAVAPFTSKGKLDRDITEDVEQTFTLTPEDIGTEYSESGWATIGSEVVAFTRSGDDITVTARAQYGTKISSHSEADTFQEAWNIQSMRVDDLLYELLTVYAKVDPAFCPKATKWEPEITIWLSSLRLDTVIAKPTGVSQLIGELAELGLSIWWDEVNQEIGLQASHPVTDEEIIPISDRDNIKSISQEDNDDERITQVHFYLKQSDPTVDYKSKSNYDQINVIVDTDSESENAYDSSTIREVYCRWLNKGAQSVTRLIALRLLNRFNTAPKTVTVTLDAVDRGLGLTDVANLSSYVITDETGAPKDTLMQIFQVKESKSGHEIQVSMQEFQYQGGRFGYCMPDTTTSTYDTATDTERATGNYAVDGTTLKFSDGTDPYVAI